MLAGQKTLTWPTQQSTKVQASSQINAGTAATTFIQIHANQPIIASAVLGSSTKITAY
jgi:hypothetical protein